jgi:hypothetical protein
MGFAFEELPWRRQPDSGVRRESGLQYTIYILLACRQPWGMLTSLPVAKVWMLLWRPAGRMCLLRSEVPVSRWRWRLHLPLLLLLSTLAALPADARVVDKAVISSDAMAWWHGGHDPQRERSVLQSLLAPLPGVAISPSLTAASVAGAALVCRTSVNVRFPSLCQAPLVAHVSRSASLGLFVALSVFALICFFANTGKLQGLVGKLLKLLEIGPAVFAYFLVARDILGDTATSPIRKASAFSPGSFPSWVALGVCLGLLLLLLVRLTVEMIVWLSPFPFVDAIFETLSRVLAFGFLVLALVSPGTAAVLAVVGLGVALLLVRSSLRGLRFVFRMVVRPLYCRLVKGPMPALIEPAWADKHADEGCTLAIPATALNVPGVHQRESGRLVSGPDGVFFVSRGRLARERRQRLDGIDRHLRLLRRPFWTEVLAVQRSVPVARLALADDLHPLRRGIAARLGAEELRNDIP